MNNNIVTVESSPPSVPHPLLHPLHLHCIWLHPLCPPTPLVPYHIRFLSWVQCWWVRSCGQESLQLLCVCVHGCVVCNTAANYMVTCFIYVYCEHYTIIMRSYSYRNHKKFHMKALMHVYVNRFSGHERQKVSSQDVFYVPFIETLTLCCLNSART